MTEPTGPAMHRCDGLDCAEAYPVEHDCHHEFGFTNGRWPGWLYLDINRPDITDRPLRFCGRRCLEWWLERETATHRQLPQSETSIDLVSIHRRRS